MDQLPANCRAHRARQMWLYSGPLICFWIVEWHAPERVLRQFGYRQVIPPPPDFHDHLHDVRHRPNTNIDWAEEHREFVDMWRLRRHHLLNPPQEPWDESMHAAYLAWYSSEGMRTLFRQFSTVQGVYRPYIEPEPEDHLSQTYTHRSERNQHLVSLFAIFVYNIYICCYCTNYFIDIFCTYSFFVA